ncbi:MAG: SDR family oxidoreductase [Phycisphaeraceae bacterium]|nr:MAG: SDR family oxidoreductase [Phycisphaeraceae bacterium]
MSTHERHDDAPVALITGAGSGIGRALAHRFSHLGYRTVLAGRREPPLHETADALPLPSIVAPADLTSPNACQSVVDLAVEHFGRLDALVNNAGWAPCTPIDLTTPSLLHDAFDINALAPGYLTLAAWKVFLKQNAADHAAGKPPRGGTLIYISSMATLDPFPGLFAYAAAKASLNLMARAAHNEGKDHGIRAFSFAPGAVETDMLRGIVSADLLPADRTLKPDDVAQLVVQCLTPQLDEQRGQTILIPSP